MNANMMKTIDESRAIFTRDWLGIGIEKIMGDRAKFRYKKLSKENWQYLRRTDTEVILHKYIGWEKRDGFKHLIAKSIHLEINIMTGNIYYKRKSDGKRVML